MCVLSLTMNQYLPISVRTWSYFLICLTFSSHYFLGVANVFSHWRLRLTTQIHYTLHSWSIWGYLWESLSASASKEKCTASEYFMASAVSGSCSRHFCIQAQIHIWGKKWRPLPHIDKAAIKPNNYDSWVLGPHRTVQNVCWILQLQVIFISFSSLTARSVMFRIAVWVDRQIWWAFRAIALGRI